MSWTDERVELLRRLWNEGLSASQVAAEIGAGITRNAVIGKIHRLGLSQRAKTPIAARPRAAKQPRLQQNGVAVRAAAASAPSVMGNVALALSPCALPQVEARPQEEVVIPMTERVTIMELRETMCRWPIGDPTSAEFRFCGARTPGGAGGPYCGFHAQVAYQPAQDRRRSRDDMKTARIA
ncbi:GcrA family cell cycle regulator [Methylosinus sp. Sm6]|uniref:GcrA family cell cycle regulator n=1 Tax=Methylosinus sp. Sm6 TaxID=2866948 RepID=UPI001C99DE86|nr:GcrA family cell cycle regulator [Methylosinus sp. Sm6]MBY6241752.1 GcrA cell cycle regulator [Methylosinus sp. Sm6]